MHDIGSGEEARQILKWVRSFEKDEGVPECVWEERAPEGWEFLGKGSYRSVWRSPTGAAYKVNHNEWDDQGGAEIDSLIEAWKREPLEGCRIPRFNAYEWGDDIVVIMEVIHGSTLCEYWGDNRRDLWDLMREAEKYYRLYDMHDENVMVDAAGQLVVVDFGG